MTDIYDPVHEQFALQLFQRTCALLDMPGFVLRPLRRRVRGRGKLRSLTLGYTRLGSNLITIDLYTPRTMKPRKTDALLRVFCHELTHHQEPPRLVRVWFRLKRMSHHPAFWNRYRKNVAELEQDAELGEYFKK